MKATIALVLLVDAYLIVYYRLMAKFYQEKITGSSQSGMAAIFSIPGYRGLPVVARKYVRRYWWAIAVMGACVAALFVVSDMRFPA